MFHSERVEWIKDFVVDKRSVVGGSSNRNFGYITFKQQDSFL